MPDVTLTITIPEAAQPRMLEALNWIHRTDTGSGVVLGNLSGAEARGFLVDAIEKYLKSRVGAALREKAAYEAEGWDF